MLLTALSLRGDYGSTWEGGVAIRNCRWLPGCGRPTQPYLIGGSNDGRHDFGYPCFMPREVTIDGLFSDDSHHPDDYAGPCLFSGPNGRDTAAAKPFPYRPAEQVTIRGLTTASGLKSHVSPDAAFAAGVRVSEADRGLSGKFVASPSHPLLNGQ